MNWYYRMLVSAWGLSSVSEGVLLPIYALYVQQIGGTILDAAGAVAAYFVLQGVVEILVHRSAWSHRHRMVLMIGGWAVWLLGISTYLWVASVPMLFVAQILTGLGNAIANPAFDAELAQKADKKIIEYEYSVFEGLQDIAQGFAALLGGLVAYTFGFTVLIAVMIGTASISFALILLYKFRAHARV